MIRRVNLLHCSVKFALASQQERIKLSGREDLTFTQQSHDLIYICAIMFVQVQSAILLLKGSWSWSDRHLYFILTMPFSPLSLTRSSVDFHYLFQEVNVLIAQILKMCEALNQSAYLSHNAMVTNNFAVPPFIIII